NTVFVSVAQDGEIAEVDLETLEVKRRVETGPVPDGINLAAGDIEPAARAQAPAQQQPAPAPGQRPRLGVAVQSAGFSGGVEVVEVMADSVAEKAGLKVGDVITKLNGKATDDPQGFVDAVFAAEAGKPVTLTVRREGE